MDVPFLGDPAPVSLLGQSFNDPDQIGNRGLFKQPVDHIVTNSGYKAVKSTKTLSITLKPQNKDNKIKLTS